MIPEQEQAIGEKTLSELKLSLTLASLETAQTKVTALKRELKKVEAECMKLVNEIIQPGDQVQLEGTTARWQVMNITSSHKVHIRRLVRVEGEALTKHIHPRIIYKVFKTDQPELCFGNMEANK